VEVRSKWVCLNYHPVSLHCPLCGVKVVGDGFTPCRHVALMFFDVADYLYLREDLKELYGRLEELGLSDLYFLIEAYSRVKSSGAVLVFESKEEGTACGPVSSHLLVAFDVPEPRWWRRGEEASTSLKPTR